MKKIKKGDLVIILGGKDKGRQGQIRSMLEGRVIVEGFNMVKRAVKSNPLKGVVGGVVVKEASIAFSQVALWDPGAAQINKVGIKLADGRRVRFSKSSGKVLGE